MELPNEMRRILTIAVLGGLLAMSLAPAGSASARAAAPAPNCGLTTLQGTVDIDPLAEGNPLKCGPGEPLVVRKALGKPKPDRDDRQVPLLSFFSIADTQLADEESPLRAEFLDKCMEHPATAAFRPHETMVPHLMNAHVKAANAVAAKGSPVLDQPLDFVVGLGDLADNNQFNEMRWIIDIFDGPKLIDPDTGAEGYEGVQTNVPAAPNAALDSPVEGETILNIANEPFWAPGLRAKGKRIPWYSLPGNHDVKVQGTAPNTPGFREWAEAWVTGPIKYTDAAPEQQQKGCEGGYGDPAWYMETFSNPSHAKVIEADPDRRLLSREEWVEAHFTTAGIPVGHGFKGNRCTDENGDPLFRACYAFDHGPFRIISLDSNPDEGLESGNIDDPQWQWLQRELVANSTRYFDESSAPQTNEKGRDRLILIWSHHTRTSMDNTSTEGGHTGDELRNLLLRFPNVIMHNNGHTHQNKIWWRKNKELKTRYWEVNTSAIADNPFQSRTVEIADNRDGMLSIFAVVINALAPVDPRVVDWEENDPTSEMDLADAERNINEDWLAAAGREVGYYDPQQDLTKLGTPKDRNVELLIRAPFNVRALMRQLARR